MTSEDDCSIVLPVIAEPSVRVEDEGPDVTVRRFISQTIRQTDILTVDIENLRAVHQ